MKLVLIGCSMTKLPQPEYKDRRNDVLPVELYGGQLFRKRVAQAEEQGLPWMVPVCKVRIVEPHEKGRSVRSELQGSQPS